MPLNVVVGGAERASSRGEVTVGAVQKRVTRIEAWNGSAWKSAQLFVQPLIASQSPTGTIETDKILNLETVISYPVTAVPSGGLAPYSYAWTILSGAGVSASTATKATTTFRKTMDPGQSVSGSARCTVTDSLGTTATVDVSYSLFNSSGLDSPI